jgi:hypothetical protein
MTHEEMVADRAFWVAVVLLIFEEDKLPNNGGNPSSAGTCHEWLQ